jgi:hypothetical protein
VGDVDPDAVAEAFLAAMSFGSGVERVMGLMWRQARLIRVERRSPLTAASGKILHLHVPDGGRPGQGAWRRSSSDAGGSGRREPEAGAMPVP